MTVGSVIPSPPPNSTLIGQPDSSRSSGSASTSLPVAGVRNGKPTGVPARTFSTAPLKSLCWNSPATQQALTADTSQIIPPKVRDNLLMGTSRHQLEVAVKKDLLPFAGNHWENPQASRDTIVLLIGWIKSMQESHVYRPDASRPAYDLGLSNELQLLEKMLAHIDAVEGDSEIETAHAEGTEITVEMWDASAKRLRSTARAILKDLKHPTLPTLRCMAAIQVSWYDHNRILNGSAEPMIRAVIDALAATDPGTTAVLLSGIGARTFILSGLDDQAIHADCLGLSELLAHHPDPQVRDNSRIDLLVLARTAILDDRSIRELACAMITQATADPATQLSLANVYSALRILAPFIPPESEEMPNDVLRAIDSLLHKLPPLSFDDSNDLANWLILPFSRGQAAISIALAHEIRFSSFPQSDKHVAHVAKLRREYFPPDLVVRNEASELQRAAAPFVHEGAGA